MLNYILPINILQLRLKLSLLLGILCILIGCRDIEDDSYILPTPSGKQIDITLSTSISSVATKTMSEDDENRMEHVDILVFLSENNEERFAYRTHNINDLSVQSQYVKGSFQESENGEKYRIVLLANLRNEINELFEKDDCEGMLKEDLIRKITFKQEGRWPANNNMGYRALPMWGEASAVTVINKGTTPDSFGGEIQMLRSVARIQVGVNISTEGGTSDGTDFFDLSEVKVYNARKDGYAVPFNYNLDNEGKAEAPSIIDDSEIIDADNMSYVLSQIDPSHKNQLKNNIYINEALNEGAEPEEALFLIIKGFYTEEGEPQNTSKPTYYRVDFYDGDEEVPADSRINILRNFSYYVNIVAINGPGYEDEDTAVKSIPQNMEVSIKGWSDGDMKYVVFHGPHYLAVTDSTFDLPKDDESYTVGVKTNYPGGWTAVADSDTGWLTLTDPAPAASDELDTLIDLTFHLDENDTGDEKTGIIYISCGTALELEIIVNQSTKEAKKIPGTLTLREMIYVSGVGLVAGEEIEELLFSSFYRDMDGNYATSLNTALLQWDPVDVDVLFYLERGGNVNIWNYRTDSSMTLLLSEPNFATGENSQGIRTGTMRCDFWLGPFTYEDIENDPFCEKSSTFNFILMDDEPILKQLSLHQVHWNLIAEPKDSYVLDGAYSNLRVRSNCDWTARILEDQYQIIERIITPQGQKSILGRNIEFKLINDQSITDAEATIRFEYIGDDNRSRYTDVVIRANSSSSSEDKARVGGSSNSYILDPENTEGIIIHVIRANEDGNQRISSNEELNWKLIWTDHPGGIDPNGSSSIRSVKLSGKGPEATLTVYPGSAAGNAVIAVTNADGSEIYWSWHIWVTHFDPDDANNTYTNNGYVLMDRNLGAHIDDANDGYKDPAFWGLFYQWGRKDPFPQAAAIGSQNHRPIYDADGNPVYIGVIENRPQLGANESNMEYAIRNPLDYIGRYSGTEDWYHSNVNYTNDELWITGGVKGGKKTVYDPCPEGWMVPEIAPEGDNGVLGGIFSEWQGKTITFDTENYMFISSVLGYWPAAGMINKNNSGTFHEVGTGGCYWSSLPNPGSGRTSYAGYWSQIWGFVTPGHATSRSAAAAIRCMKEN